MDNFQEEFEVFATSLVKKCYIYVKNNPKSELEEVLSQFNVSKKTKSIQRWLTEEEYIKYSKIIKDNGIYLNMCS